MSKLPKHLQKRIDFESFRQSYHEKRMSSGLFYCKNKTSLEEQDCLLRYGFEQGASAMHSLMLEEMKPIVAIINDLEKYMHGFNKEESHHELCCQVPTLAREALSHYRQKIEGPSEETTKS